MRLKHPVGPYTVTTAARRYGRHRQHLSTTTNAYDSCVSAVRASEMVPDSWLVFRDRELTIAYSKSKAQCVTPTGYAPLQTHWPEIT
jgi:hypothetical protein